MNAAAEGFVNVLAAVDYIRKETSKQVNYSFRTVDAVMNALHKHFADNRIFPRPRVLDDWRVQMIPGTKDREQVQAVFRVAVDAVHADGSSVEVGIGLAQSHDYGDKAVYQAQQNAYKYVLLEALCIPTGEQDMDGREADAIPPRQQPTASTDAGRKALVKSLYDQLPKSQQDEVDEAAGMTEWWTRLTDAGLDKAAKKLEERLDALRAEASRALT